MWISMTDEFFCVTVCQKSIISTPLVHEWETFITINHPNSGVNLSSSAHIEIYEYKSWGKKVS
jgi:hypothetical protein